MDVQARDIILLKGKKPDTFYFYLVDFFDPEAQYFSAYRIHMGGKYYHNRDFRIPKEYMKTEKVKNNGGYINLFTGRACFDKKYIIEVVGRLPQDIYTSLLAKYIVIATGGWYCENGTYKIGDTKVPLDGIVFNFSAVSAMTAIKKKHAEEKKEDSNKKKYTPRPNGNKPGFKKNTPPVQKPQQPTTPINKDRVRPGAAFGPKKKEKKPTLAPTQNNQIRELSPLLTPPAQLNVEAKDINIEARVRNGRIECAGIDYKPEEKKPDANTVTVTPREIKAEDIRPPEPVKPSSGFFDEPEYKQMDYQKVDMTVVKRRYNACTTRTERLDELYKMLEDPQGCIPVGDVYRYIFIDYKGSPKMRKPNTKAVMLTRGELETMADAKTFEDVEGMGFYRYGSEGSISELASKQSYFDLMEKCKALCDGKTLLK